MSDVMRPQPFDVLLDWILTELEENESIFGIHRSLFYEPREEAPYATTMFGHRLATPIGPGAGPHTQLTQNIIAAWLSGGRFIELKTVQIMDELEIPRPCIDMADEGYNVEWSQELKLEQSAWEYVKAWVLIHVLRRVLPSTSSGQTGFEDVPFGTVFNMSVGYDLEGIQSAPMTHFMDRMEDASEEIAQLQAVLEDKFPQFAGLEIPSQMVDSVTLSTMHGCPPHEIEQISRYLLEERGLHTFVKLNPTLLGRERVMSILHDHLGFSRIRIPDEIFEHDLQYDQAVDLIASLKQVAAERGLTFGVKLSNTLAMANHRDALPGDEMYMSGRALYPITMSLFQALVEEFDGDPSAGPSTSSGHRSGQRLDVSYSAGADAFNVSAILSCGALPVTTVSDILKPGGYSRLVQYLENLEQAMHRMGVESLEELTQDRVANLEQAATQALQDPRYEKDYHPYGLPKVESGLELFDCVAAPCVEQCAVLQDVPEYAWLIAQGEYDRALEVILHRNPLPAITGYVCNHLCQTRCTRSNYDEPVAIRALKRFAEEKGAGEQGVKGAGEQESKGARVAVVGGGPSGLAAAYFLALNGVRPTIYEARDRAGGMPAVAPNFRLPQEVVQRDVDRIRDLGAEIVLSHPVTEPPEAFLEEGFDAVYVASGAQKDARLGIEGEDGAGVYHALDLLERVIRGDEPGLSGDVLVIGGGNTAMDAARTAQRLTDGVVTVVYRRTEREMPADEEEIEAIFAEGIALEELTSPKRIVLEDDEVVALACIRNELGEPGPDGRRRPMPIEGSEFQMAADAVIVAIGQRPDVSFLDGSTVSLRDNKTIDADVETRQAGGERIYAGGDAVRGPATIIEACADGRRAAEAICQQLGVPFDRPSVQLPHLSREEILAVKQVRVRKAAQHHPPMLPPEQRGRFDLVEMTLTEEQALAEANRCMQCSHVCDKCVEVCPNRANYTYFVQPVELAVPTLACENGGLQVVGEEAFQVTQARQILHVEDFCNDCGNCATFCVHQGKPYEDKPRLFLSESHFEREDDNAFYLERTGGNWSIRRREGGEESRLTLDDGGAMTFENDRLSIKLTSSRPPRSSVSSCTRQERPLAAKKLLSESHFLDLGGLCRGNLTVSQLKIKVASDFKIESIVLKQRFEGTFSLVGLAEMAVILEGLVQSVPFLLSR